MIAAYERDLRQRTRCGAVTVRDLAALDGKRLGCWCAPLPCHGDVLAAYARRARAHLDAQAHASRAGAGHQVA